MPFVRAWLAEIDAAVAVLDTPDGVYANAMAQDRGEEAASELRARLDLKLRVVQQQISGGMGG